MGKETRLFKSEERRTRPEVSAFLHRLADKLAELIVAVAILTVRYHNDSFFRHFPRLRFLDAKINRIIKRSAARNYRVFQRICNLVYIAGKILE